MQWFHVIFYQPIYNLLVWLYEVVPGADIGVSIILVTVIVKGLTYPLTYKSLKSQKDLQEVQPKINAIKEKYKDSKEPAEREKMAKELMGVYKEHNVNPLASCLPLLIQLPIFIALYNVLRDGLGAVHVEDLYPFVSDPGTIDAVSLGIVNLAAVSWPLAILAGIAQYFQAKVMINRRPPTAVKTDGTPAADEAMLASMNKTMLYFMPAMTIFLGTTSLPGGVMLYWCITTVLTYVMYKLVLGKTPKENKA